MGLKDALLLRVAKRWIAGVDLDSAIEDAKQANGKGWSVLINFLGEEIDDPAITDTHVDQYLALQGAISSAGVNGCASVKLTQFGLRSDEKAAALRLEKVASNAERLDQPLWMDMEGHSFLERTLKVYTETLTKHRELGLALQAYMRRGESDLRRLLDAGARIRLCKGAYREPGDIVFPTRKEIDLNFAKELAILFDRGDNFTVATHDSRMVDEAKRLAESRHVNFEFAMLKGIRDELKEELVRSGYRVSEYIPYGDRWFAYSKRRITEHPSNIWLLLRSLA